MGQGNDWADRMKAEFMRRLTERRAMMLAVTGTMDEVAERVWGKGELTDGGSLRYKEDYEVWAYKPPAPKKPSGKGKPDKEGKRRNIKGGYYPTYLAFKEDMGRRELPFELTGSMRQDWLGGTTPTPTEVSPTEVIITMDTANVRKMEGLTQMKGAFLDWNEKEQAAYSRRVREILLEP